jgi:hypothetical protein
VALGGVTLTETTSVPVTSGSMSDESPQFTIPIAKLVIAIDIAANPRIAKFRD